MTYELAKQLKDAGFPQVGLKYTWYYSTNPMGIYNSGDEYLDVKNHPDRVVIPTLSELVEACGDMFSELRKHDIGRWVAFAKDIDSGRVGTTPEEAVARLWFKLKEK